MLDSWIGRSVRIIGGMALGVGMACPIMARADLPPGKPFVLPKDRAEWDARRPTVLATLEAEVAREVGERSNHFLFNPADPITPQPPGVIVERVTLLTVRPKYSARSGVFVRPDSSGATGRLPLIVVIAQPSQCGDQALTTGWDGRPSAVALARFGCAVLALDAINGAAEHVQTLRASLDAVLARPEVDPTRVAVLSLGRNGLVALRLMAFDPRITCGVVAIESQEIQSFQYLGASRAAGMRTTPIEPRSNHAEELVALCAPRPLALMIGEPLPLPPSAKSIGRIVERAAKGAYKVYPKEGTGLSFTLFGEFPGHQSVGTRLQWMGGLEHLDKNFRPQGPTPLAHSPEPEPTFDHADSAVLNLTEKGMAGWAPEMSGRDSTWTWRDGVIACQPKANEYGWLRCPVEVADFLLQVEWNVPERGNAGIFLRAKPVDWLLPPTEENKLRIASLGLTWPSRTGLELQTQADPGDANRYSTGSLYRHAAPASNPTRSPNQWNRSTVRARGPRVEVWNNGVQVLDANLNQCDDTLPDPPLKGYFGLQNHGAPAQYRAIRLKRLTADPSHASSGR